jgi:hypothetical protein
MEWSLFFMLVSSIVIEITILLIDQILDHFVRHPIVKLMQVCTGYKGNMCNTKGLPYRRLQILS